MTSDQTPLSVQLGFSEPITEPSQRKLVAHNSPNWLDWDGGKIGGRPSWLNPQYLPQQGPFRCPACVRRNGNEGTILRFITQIYSPADKETNNDEAFHRSLYVFACPDPLCSKEHDSILVLRGQLPCSNPYYPSDCEEDEEDGEEEESLWTKHKSEAWNVQTCAVCGQRASGKCPKLQKWFCGTDHQRIYNRWLKGKEDLVSITYEESELVVEEEPIEGGDGGEGGGSDSASLKEQEKLAKKLNETSIFVNDDDDSSGDNKEDEGDDELLEQSDLNDMTGANNAGGGGTSDQVTMEFYTRIGVGDGDVKSQCLRYSRWPTPLSYQIEDEETSTNGPLWIRSDCRPSEEKDIPPCQYCGKLRQFEFQLMPQMVNFLLKNKTDNTGNDMDDSDEKEKGKKALLVASDIVQKADQSGTGEQISEAFREKQEQLLKKYKDEILTKNDESGRGIDWGTVAVYSCTASCGGSAGVDEKLGAYRKEFAWRQPPLDG